MILAVTERQSHCTGSLCRLKHAFLLAIVAVAPQAAAQEPFRDSVLRRDITQLVASGRTADAIQRAQTALRENPADAGVRGEYIDLHLALAREWLSQRRFDDCLAATDAILAVQPDHHQALEIRQAINSARAAAAQQTPEITRLLRLELFETALERIQEVRTLRPDLAGVLATHERTAWLGAAEDHYFAGNFNEALALYEHVWSLDPGSREVSARWLLSLALVLSESDGGRAIEPDVAARLRERFTTVQARAEQPCVGHAIVGLLAEREARLIDAGQAYAAALDSRWQLPPVDRRRAAVADLRRQVVERLRGLYDATRGRVRDGAWQIALPGDWNHRQSAHFDVYARNDLVAERLAEAAEFHFIGLSDWLNTSDAHDWSPRCELRIHATLADLRENTGARGATHALTQTRRQGDRVLLRQINLVQDDPDLLASTLPHELTHILLAGRQLGDELPRALEEGLALQAESPARRLQIRRVLPPTAPAPAEILAVDSLPADELAFYARCDALTTLLLRRAAAADVAGTGPSPVSTVLRAFEHGCTGEWWKVFGWDSAAAMRADWHAWYESRREPPRMPLMFLAQPSKPNRDNGD